MSSEKKGKNDCAWEQLFARHRILTEIEKHGQFSITANQIKEFREPRLMAKFDHRIHLPRIFADNQLAILPVSRGAYRIAPFDCYQDLEPVHAPIRQFSLPGSLQSIDPVNISSEAVALNAALAAGILADFAREEHLLPTVSGRMGSGNFDFRIASLKTGESLSVKVNNAQIEIDAALEGTDCLLLVEAKHELAQDFIIRQLFYPFKAWSRRVTKKVRPVFFVFSNSIFHLYEYAFDAADDYNSIRLIQQRKYSLESTDIALQDIESIAAAAEPCAEPDIPFPQADSFARVINLCEILYARSLTREEATQEYAFDGRQTNYYTDAGRYLGLIRKDASCGTPVYSLTEQGATILNLPYKARQLALCERILRHGAFLAVFRERLHTGAMPGKDRVVEHMKQAALYHVEGESTYRRRASTVSNWINWIFSLPTPQYIL